MKRFTQKLKDGLVQGYLESRSSCTEYCKQKGIHPNSLYRWKKQYEAKQGKQSSFVEIAAPGFVSDNRQNIYIEIRTKNVRVQIPATIGKDQLEFLFTLMGLAHVS